MLKKLFCLLLTIAAAAVYTGCAENEHKITHEKQTQTESEPHDTKPGEMVP